KRRRPFQASRRVLRYVRLQANPAQPLGRRACASKSRERSRPVRSVAGGTIRRDGAPMVYGAAAVGVAVEAAAVGVAALGVTVPLAMAAASKCPDAPAREPKKERRRQSGPSQAACEDANAPSCILRSIS